MMRVGKGQSVAWLSARVVRGRGSNSLKSAEAARKRVETSEVKRSADDLRRLNDPPRPNPARRAAVLQERECLLMPCRACRPREDLPNEPHDLVRLAVLLAA